MDGSIGAYEAKTKLSELLDRVERGEEITITRRGVPVARLVPAERRHSRRSAEEIAAELARFREELRQDGVKPFSTAEILDLIQSGRRY